MRALIFDPFAGISGDMILGALVDLGLDVAWLDAFVASLGLDGVVLRVEAAQRRGIACRQVRFELPPERAHRHLSDVLEVIEHSGCAASVRERAAAIFHRLAEAEADVHGVSVDAIHFHEVGALDAILDVLCAVAGLAELGIERVYTRPVALGHGWIQIEHGRFPVPAPATLKLLQGLPVRETSLEGECTTPTGAAILAGLVERTRPPATFTLYGSGYGAGERDPADRPNCLRAILCDPVVPEAADRLYLVQADLDDFAPEYAPSAQDALFEAGALDAVTSTVGMKKGRPALRLEALVSADRLDGVLDALFRATSTIGARYWPVARPMLERRQETVEWRGHRLRRKRVKLPGGGERSKLEYEDIARVARELGLSPFEVRVAVETEAALVAPDE